jgi:hypothetical protein
MDPDSVPRHVARPDRTSMGSVVRTTSMPAGEVTVTVTGVGRTVGGPCRWSRYVPAA